MPSIISLKQHISDPLKFNGTFSTISLQIYFLIYMEDKNCVWQYSINELIMGQYILKNNSLTFHLLKFFI